MPKFPVVPLTDICDVLSGGTPKTSVPEYWNGEIPWASVKDFNINSRWFSSTDKRISREGLDSCSSVLLEPGELVISARGTVGVIAQPTMHTAFNQSNYGLKAKQGLAYNDYLYYALVHANKALLGDTHGGMFDTITRSTLDRLLVPNPPLEEQRRIADALGIFDEKIALNTALTKTLENLAQSIFKSWFIDFDPVKAKMAGEKPIGMDVETASLFPDSFVNLKNEVIPQGWKLEQIGNFCTIQGGKMLSRSEFNAAGEFPIYGGAGIMGKTNKTNAEGFVITFGRVGAYCGQFFYHRGSAWVNNNASRVIPIESISGEWVYLTLKAFDIESIKKGAAQPFVSNSDLSDSFVLLPPIEIIKRFTEIVRPMFKKSESLVIEAELLRKLRDGLLSRLISGELSIPDMKVIS